MNVPNIVIVNDPYNTNDLLVECYDDIGFDFCLFLKNLICQLQRAFYGQPMSNTMIEIAHQNIKNRIEHLVSCGILYMDYYSDTWRMTSLACVGNLDGKEIYRQVLKTMK
jgi:hypothetical protein